MKQKTNKFKQWILSVVIMCLYHLNKNLHMKIVNSKIWHHIYYKHTTKHKKDLMEVTNRVLKIRKEAIGR